MHVIGKIIPYLFLGALAFIFWDPFQRGASAIYNKLMPCTSPLAYSLGTFDDRFGISQKDFLEATKQAEAIWEKKAGKDLFVYDPKGELTVSLVYDYRQEATEKLRSYGLTINNDKASYSEVKQKYEELNTRYKQESAEFEALLAAYNTKQEAYGREVERWNSRGGAPQKEYQRLQATNETLRQEADRLKGAQTQLNQDVEVLNALSKTLNELIDTLNMNIAHYNETGASRGQEFEEGIYETDAEGERIAIYEYSNRAELIRVLAHELGHALGLGHVEDKNAIMYKLNESKNQVPTEADMVEMKRVCRMK